MKNYFYDVAQCIDENLQAGEQYLAWFSGEEMDYVRFNKAKLRMAGSVNQKKLSLDLVSGQKHARVTLSLTDSKTGDTELIKSSLNRLRGWLSKCADDPFLLFNNTPNSTEYEDTKSHFDKDEIVEYTLAQTTGLDFVGSYIGGPIYKGFASSSGQRNWFKKSSFILDYSLYHSLDKAVKQSYASDVFLRNILAQKIEEGRQGLSLLAQESHTISRGSYRVYFSPAAVYEILSLLNWNGFSKKAIEVKSSPLGVLNEQKKRLSSAFSLSENIGDGVGPNFQGQGFIKPKNLALIDSGQLKNTLISPKTAKEYGIDHNGADANEALVSMDLKGGALAQNDIMKTLGDGLYINNLWYLNFSDRQNGCMTGMTRFFCFKVKNGQPLAPFSVMRFDDSIYRIFGENLRFLTKERELIIENSTYEERATVCARLPGMIVDDVRFTL